MIYDCFLYNGEKDLLKIRLEEFRRLDPFKKYMPVKHVLIESIWTFSGVGKETSLRFKKEDFPDSDIYSVCLNDAPYSPESFDENMKNMVGTPWDNETYQRNGILTALLNLGVQDDDIVLISDCDEIPRAYAIQHYRPEFGLVALQMDQYYLYLNSLAERNNWNIPKIMSWKYLKDKTPDGVRRSGYDYALIRGGWHYSYMGDVDTLMRKFKSFSHQEPEVQRMADRELLSKKLDNAESIWSNDRLTFVNMDELPYYVQTHLEEFKHLIYVR